MLRFIFTILTVTLVVNVHCKYVIQEPKEIEYAGTPEAFVNLGGRFYYFEPTIKANWYMAFEFCRRLDMLLVSIETKVENDLIINYIKEIGSGIYWTSGSDLANENQFVWSSTGQPLTYTDWGESEPNNLGGEEACIQLINVNNLNHWNDDDCPVQSYFICEQF